MEKPHISSILIPGAKLEATKIDTNDPRVIALIEKTIAEQEAVLKLKRFDPRLLEVVINI